MPRFAQVSNPNPAARVHYDTLTPCQQPTSRGFRTSTNFYQQWMIKHPFLSEFHSYAEYLHAGLLEGDPSVLSFVPQPFHLRVGRRRYTPDVYVVQQGQRRVLELKPDGSLREALRAPLSAFFERHGMVFDVVDIASVYARRLEAENWLEIVRMLHLGRDWPTEADEEVLLARLRAEGPCLLRDIVDPGDREASYGQELALFRLLHRGVVQAPLAKQPLHLDLDVRLCG